VRFDRLLANLGHGSRAEVRALIASGRCSVDGTVMRDGARHIESAMFQTVTVDGELLDHPHGVCVALYKPVGYVCSHDPSEGQRAYDLLPERWMARNPRPEGIGRLDRDTSGLWIVTDDHVLVHRLASPKHHVAKRYEAVLDAELDASAPAQLESGTLVLDGESTPCLPATVAIDGDDARRVSMTITEGRYHQVRRMFAAVGRHVVSLHRATFGSVDLAALNLAPGEWADITL
jgi:16S rRNA pseudouridine516 synthase